MTTPGISIALCTYNGAQFLDQQLASLFGQTLPPNEIVICDDGSTDNTIAIVQQWQQQQPGIIRLYQNASNLGFGLNFKQAIEYCTQDIIFLSDQGRCVAARKNSGDEQLAAGTSPLQWLVLQRPVDG
ncbi:glycosyltransferase [Phnomibacter ginsenosidimutans]|uniref:glycosyltransferase n=1 Tax=Phnomibacter ginsenosidimutans TaxID=2676868 RepID=UPI0018D25560|nr:glycosyltransferase [Phnomibacter ginsenosidimutans]